MNTFADLKEMRMRILILLLAILSGSVAAQNGNTYSYGGLVDDIPYSIDVDQLGNMIIAGSSRSFGAGSEDFYLLKIDSVGRVLLNKSFGGSHHDIARKVLSTSDGGFLLVGEKWDGGFGREDMYVLKLDSDGNQDWEAYYGENHTDQGFSAIETQTGFLSIGYTASLGGSTRGNFIVSKSDLEGNLLWQKDYGTPYLDYGFEILEKPSGELLLLGCSGGFYNYARADFKNSNSKALIIQTNPEGIEEWRISVGGDKHDWGKDFILDGASLYMLGSTQSFGNGSFDMYLVKLSDDGRLVWQKTYGGQDFEYGESIAMSNDQHLYLVGTTRTGTSNNDSDIFVVKTDLDGNFIWEQRLGGQGSDYGHDIISLQDGGCMILGSIDNLDKSGKDYHLIRLTKDGYLMSKSDVDISLSEIDVKVYPNPFSEKLVIDYKDPSLINQGFFTLYNNAGQIVLHMSLESSNNRNIEIPEIPDGVFFYQIIIQNKEYGGTLIKK